MSAKPKANKKISTNTHNNNNNKSPGGSRSSSHKSFHQLGFFGFATYFYTILELQELLFFCRWGVFFCASSNSGVPANSEGRNLASLLSLVHKRLNVNRVLFLGAQVDDTCVHVCTSLIGRKYTRTHTHVYIYKTGQGNLTPNNGKFVYPKEG